MTESRAAGPPSPSRRSRLLPKPVAELVAAGLVVLPARFKGKEPALRTWAAYLKRKPTQEELSEWFRPGQHRNYFVVTGSISGVAVLDIDSDRAHEEWRAKLGDILDTTTAATTGKGTHYWFRLPEGAKVPSVSVEGWDFRAEGTGVIAPPSMHQSGKRYTWIRGLEHLQPLPDELSSADGQGPEPRSGKAGSKSQLTALLSSPPDAGARNDWLTRVAGHYAKTFHDKQDAYELHVRMAANKLKTPLSEAEIKKVVDSVWKGEHERHRDRFEGSETGWLRSVGGKLIGETYKGEFYPFADFDIIARGFSIGTGWLVELVNGKESYSTILSPVILADRRRIDVLLGGYGLQLGAGADLPGYGRIGSRLIRYLQSQHPPKIKTLYHCDYDSELGGFATDEGLIRPGATQIEPAPVMIVSRDPDHWKYGFEGGFSQARRILREVLTWHDETVTCVFGAWWAACLVKFWVDTRSSLFPVMAIQAPSESGKTRGFFSAMLALNGNTIGGHDATKAALRDSLSANRIGIVWVDDTGHIDDIKDLVRQVTAMGSMRKKSVDFTQESAELVNPLVLSGESIGVHGEKAMLDRMIFLDVPSPKERTTKTGELQWDSITKFRTEYPDFSVFAGSILSEAMRVYQEIDGDNLFHELTLVGGREGHKAAILRLGAIILDKLAGTTAIREVVGSWLETSGGLIMSNENKLTLEHLPRALVYTSSITHPRAAFGTEPPTPAFVNDGNVWFNPTYLAEWLVKTTKHQLDDRVDSAEAIRQQAWALGIRGPAYRKTFRLSASSMSQYYRIEGELAERIIERAHGVTRA